MPRVSNIKDFRRWYRDADRKSSVIYHTGFILEDRWSVGGDPLAFHANELADYTDQVYESYLRGHVLLTQRKLDHGVYEYIATRR